MNYERPKYIEKAIRKYVAEELSKSKSISSLRYQFKLNVFKNIVNFNLPDRILMKKYEILLNPDEITWHQNISAGISASICELVEL